MATKLTAKTPAKGRPRSAISDKFRKPSKRDTPEKPGTPSASQENLLEDGSTVEKKYVIVNDEILALRIKQEDLQKLREPRPPSVERECRSEDAKSIVVRKLKPFSEWHKPPTKTLIVARPAPPDARLRPTECFETSGLRFDDSGDIIAHSILGSVEEYKKEALRRGELPLELYGEEEMRSSPAHLPVKYEKPPPYTPRTPHPRMESTDMTNALKNWTQKMRDRKRQQGYLSKLLNKPACQLTMNQGQTFRTVQETRYLIDRTLHTMEHGKGYRTGCEFWTLPEPMGAELGGINMTVTQTLRGYPPPIEHVGVPKVSQQEAGTYSRRSSDTSSRPWLQGSFLHQRLNQLGGVIREIDPHWPNLHKLEVRGRGPESVVTTQEEEDASMTAAVDDTSHQRLVTEKDSPELEDPLGKYPDVHPMPIIGPSLIFNGQPARWTGNVCAEKSAGIEARIAFEAYTTRRVTSFLEIVNDGTTAIYFDWVKVAKTNPFEVMTSRIQRFYFNTTSGVILPGDLLKFPFVFKSPNAGVFSEQWHFQTQPVLCSGSALTVTLRGVAFQEDKYEKLRADLELMLFHRQAEQIASTILSDLLEGIRTPRRPRSPIDSYITEEETFLRNNPYLHYDHRLVVRLKELYIETITQVDPEAEYSLDDWDLNIAGLKQMILTTVEEDEEDRKQELLLRLSTREAALYLEPFTPTQQRMQTTCHELLCDAIDNIVGYSMLLRTTLGMAERGDDGLPDDPTQLIRSATSWTESPHSTPSARKGSAKGSDPKKTPVPPNKAKLETKEKKTGKEPKSARASKDGKELGSKSSKTPVSGSKRPKDSTSNESQQSKITTVSGAVSAGSINTSHQGDAVSPILETKYREKLYVQVYQMMLNMADKMAAAFESLDPLTTDDDDPCTC